MIAQTPLLVQARNPARCTMVKRITQPVWSTSRLKCCTLSLYLIEHDENIRGCPVATSNAGTDLRALRRTCRTLQSAVNKSAHLHVHVALQLNDPRPRPLPQPPTTDGVDDIVDLFPAHDQLFSSWASGLSIEISAAVVHRVSQPTEQPIWPARLVNPPVQAMRLVVDPAEVGSVAITKWCPEGQVLTWQDELPLFLARLAADLPNLRHLDVQTPSIAQSLQLGIAALAPALRSLTVMVELGYNEVFRLSLELLCLTDLVVTLPGRQVMSALPTLPRLGNLTVKAHGIHALFVEALGQVCSTLRTLHIISYSVLGSRADQLQLVFPHLRDLKVMPTVFNLLFPAITATSASVVGANQAHVLPSLRSLNVRGPKLRYPLVPLAPLPALPRITDVVLGDVGLTNSHLFRFATAPHLKSLCLDYCSVAEDGSDIDNLTFSSLTDLTFARPNTCPQWHMTAHIPRLQRAAFIFGALSDNDDLHGPPMAWPEMEDLSFAVHSGSRMSLSGTAFDMMPRLQRLKLPNRTVEWVDHVPLLESVLDLTADPTTISTFPADALPLLTRLDVHLLFDETTQVPSFSLANVQDLYVTYATVPFLSLMSRLPHLKRVDGSVVVEPNDVLDVEYHDDRLAFWEEVTGFDCDQGFTQSSLVRVRVVRVVDVEYAVHRIVELAKWVCDSNDEDNESEAGEAGSESDDDAGPCAANFKVLVTAGLVEETSFKAQLKHLFMTEVKGTRLNVVVVDEEEQLFC